MISICLLACQRDKARKKSWWINFEPLVQRPEVHMGCNSWSHCVVSTSKAGTAVAATDAKVAHCQKYHDLLDNYFFQPVAIETTGVHSKSTAIFWAALQRNLLICQMIPAQGTTVVLLTPVASCCQRERWQHIGLCAS